MAMAVTYETFDGVLLSEKRGGTVTEYFGDPLGSLVRTEDSTGAATSTTSYWPYGEQRAITGSNPSPWGFVGLLGYFTDSVSRLYVRMRHYRPDTTAWMTVDPLWTSQDPYAYVGSDPSSYTDFLGLNWQPPNVPREPHWPPMFPPPLWEAPRVPPTIGVPHSRVGRFLYPGPFYDPSLNPLQFGYGNWCGQKRPGECRERVASALDGLDECCRQHDTNLGHSLFGGAARCSHCKLAFCADHSDCSLSPFPDLCSQARRRIITGMGKLCNFEMSDPACWRYILYATIGRYVAL